MDIFLWKEIFFCQKMLINLNWNFPQKNDNTLDTKLLWNKLANKQMNKTD